MLHTLPALILTLFVAAAQAADNKPVREIALVPAAEPIEYEITYRSSAQFLIPLVAMATHSESKQKTKSFTDALKTKGFNHGTYLTDMLAERLRAIGYRVTVLSNIPRSPDDPDSIDYEKLSFAGDIALQVRIEAIGYYSGFGSNAFVPKVNVGAISFTPGGINYPYEASVYYGVDAKPGKDWAISSPETANYETYEALTADLKAVDAIYRDALSKIADRVVSQFKVTSPLAPGQ